MSDRCYCSLTCQEADLPKIVEECGNYEEYQEMAPGIVEVGFLEVDYAAGEERRVLAQAGLQFFGWHSAGNDYGSGVFAVVDHHMIEVPSLHNSTIPVVPVNEDGTIASSDLEEVRAYLTLLKKVQVAFGLETSRTE